MLLRYFWDATLSLRCVAVAFFLYADMSRCVRVDIDGVQVRPAIFVVYRLWWEGIRSGAKYKATGKADVKTLYVTT